MTFIRETAVDLPAAGQALAGGPRQGDLAFTLDDNAGYFWDGSAWVQFGGSGGDPGTPLSNEDDLTDVTPVTALAAPAVGFSRVSRAKSWSVFNGDVDDRIVTFQKNVGGVITVLRTTTIPAGGTAVLDLEVSLTADDQSLENLCDVPTSTQPRLSISASEFVV